MLETMKEGLDFIKRTNELEKKRDREEEYSSSESESGSGAASSNSESDDDENYPPKKKKKKEYTFDEAKTEIVSILENGVPEVKFYWKYDNKKIFGSENY